MQTLQNESHVGAEEAEAPTAEGLLEGSNELRLCRTDWAQPVGWFYSINHVGVQEEGFSWTRIDIPAFYLGHTASLLLLQGRKLGDILVPNHYIYLQGRDAGPFFHLIVKVDPWDYTLTPPHLTHLTLASVSGLPEGIDDQEVLSAIAQRVLRG